MAPRGKSSRVQEENTATALMDRRPDGWRKCCRVVQAANILYYVIWHRAIIKVTEDYSEAPH